MWSHRVSVLAGSAAVTAVTWLLASPADARIWRVERDGTADYTTIQPAIDVAAPGDTIFVGPGRYVEYAPFTTVGNTTDTYVAIPTDRLVIRGAGRDSVIIGPDAPNFHGLSPTGINAGDEVTTVCLEMVTLQYLYVGILAQGSASVRGCRLIGCDSGVVALTLGGMRVEDCEFERNTAAIQLLEPSGTTTLVESRFTGPGGGVGVHQGRAAQATRCEFVDLSIALLCADGASALVEDCTFRDMTFACIDIQRGSSVESRRSRLQSTGYNISVTGNSVLRGDRNVVVGGWPAALRFGSGSTAVFTGGHLLKGTGQTVLCQGYGSVPVDIDLRDNYWGTAIADSISARITDGNDPHPIWQPDFSNVLFQPFSGRPVPAPSESVGGLKARFRHEN